MPIGESSTRFLNDRQQRGAIPNVHHRIEHNVGATSRHQDVTVSVTPSAARLNSLLQSVCGLPKSELFTRAEVRRQEQSFIEQRRRRNTRRFVVMEATKALRR